jgi:hypothetical protein
MLHIKHNISEHLTQILIGWCQQCLKSNTNLNMLESELNNVHRTQIVTSLYSQLYGATKA